MKRKVVSAILTLSVLTLPLIASKVAYANEPTVSYTFSGREQDLAGYAQGSVTIDPDGNSGYCVLYWANDSAVLDGYEKIASVKITPGKDVIYNMADNMAIPQGATKLAVFFSSTTECASTNLSNATVYDIPLEKQFNSGALEMTFASVSDVHVNYNNSSNNYGAPYKWTQALNYFDQLGLDMVAISGDCTGNGGASEYEVYKKAIEDSTYDEEKIYMARGNHDSQENGNFIKYASRDDMIRPFTDSPWFYVLKKGDEGEKDNLFIFMAQELSAIANTNLQDNFSTRQLDWLEGLLKTYSGTNTNIFILEHAFYHNWGPGDRYDGVYVQPMMIKDMYIGNMRLQKLLIEYKEAVFMTGHSHIAFSEMVNYSDEHNTACRMIHNSSTSQPRTYTSSGSISYNSEGRVTSTKGSEGYVVGVYANDIVYSGTNLTTRQHVPTACYIFPSYVEKRSDAKSITVTKMPDKTRYSSGEYFDPAGIEVTAKYDDGTEKVVDGWGLKSNTVLSESAKEVTITYGDLETTIPVRISKATDVFEGEGTKENPYLIQNRDDFARLTKFFESSTGSSSNDTNTFGKGLYFTQTADIDMTGYAGYTGTKAYGSAKYGFSGVYDGNGHKIKATINSSSSDISIFPYVNGVVMNVNFEGSITSSTNAQPIRTIGSNGKIINCSSIMSIKSSNANGLALSNYGKVIRFYSDCSLDGTKKNVYCNTNSGCTYVDCSYSGSVSDLNGTKTTNLPEKANEYNMPNTAAINQAVSVLKAYDESYSVKDINLWHKNMTVAEMAQMTGDNVGATKEALSAPQASEKYIVNKTFVNYSDKEQKVYAYAAVYNEDKRAEKIVSSQEIVLDPYSSVNTDLDFGYITKDIDQPYSTSIYLWNDSISPYFKADKILN